MSTLPALSESLLCAPVAMALFKMPFLLAWSMSAMIAAVGPAVITSGCAAVKERGYVARAPNFLMAAACFDDATCIIVFNLLLHAFVGSGTVSGDYDYILSLVVLLLSPFGGALAACLLSCTAIWCTPARRSAVLVIMCAMLMFVASSFEQIGAGAIANLTLGLCTRHAWLRGWPYPLLSGEHRADVGRTGIEMLQQAHKNLAALWHVAMFPLLFGLMGASFDIGRNGSPAVRAAAYALIAIGVRCVATLGITQPMPGFTRRERIFLALSWSSKAAAQAAFASAPRMLMLQWIQTHPGELLYGVWPAETLLEFADNISLCCTLAIFISNPLAMLCINNGAYFLLAKAGKRGSGGQEGAAGGDSDDDEPDSGSSADAASLPELFTTEVRATSWGVPVAAHSSAYELRPLGDSAAIAALYAAAAAQAAAPPPPVAPREVPLPPPPVGDITPAPVEADDVADAAAGAAPTLAGGPARVVFEFADLPAASEGGVRAALASASAQLAELLPAGVQVEVRHVRRATSTHANVFEDPNDDGDADAERPGQPPPSAARALRRRAAACIGGLAAPSAAEEEERPTPEATAQQMARAAGVLAFSSEAERARSAW
jgi:NhaP-type Na+/H+ or K+/H+ antiporter